jgi:hypothetical protein
MDLDHKNPSGPEGRRAGALCLIWVFLLLLPVFLTSVEAIYAMIQGDALEVTVSPKSLTTFVRPRTLSLQERRPESSHI